MFYVLRAETIVEKITQYLLYIILNLLLLVLLRHLCLSNIMIMCTNVENIIIMIHNLVNEAHVCKYDKLKIQYNKYETPKTSMLIPHFKINYIVK